MKILLATPLYPPDIGGPATYAKILNDELPKRGTLVKVISYGTMRHFPKIFSYPLYATKVFWGARKADLVLALDPMHTGLAGLVASAFWRKKFIVRIAGDYAWEQGKQRFGVKENLDEFVKKPSDAFSLPVRILRSVQTFVARHAACVIVPSQYFKSIIASWGISEERITVVYNAFENPPNLPSREQLRKNFGFSGKTLLSAGRLVPWKGFTTLIALMPEIRKHYPDCKLFIAGSGTLLHELKKQIAETGLHGIVTMLGDVPRLQLMEYIRAADCFVLNTGYEGFSHQLLEVQMIGTPVVTTHVGGNPELVQNGVTGVLVAYNDKYALQKAVEDIFQDPEHAKNMVTRGEQFAASFTVERMIGETLAVFNGLNLEQ